MTQTMNEEKIFGILTEDRRIMSGSEETVHSGSYFLGIRNKNTGAIHVTSKSANESSEDVWMYDGSEVTRTIGTTKTTFCSNSYHTS